MTLFKKLLSFTAIALLPMTGSAQYLHDMQLDPFFSYFRDARRYEISGDGALAMGYLNGVQQVNEGLYIGDTTVKRNITATGFGGNIGLSLPFKATGHISCWAATIALGFHMYSWTDLNSIYQRDGSMKAPTDNSLGATTMNISLPLGVDWKVGNDAICTKRLIFSASMGGGVIPAISMTSITGASQSVPDYMNFGFTPYAKVEGGVFLGWEVKLRLMFTMGDVNLMKVKTPIFGSTGNDGPFQLCNQANIMVSLVLMPFSGGWREYAWYNTFDTYNQHDRFN